MPEFSDLLNARLGSLKDAVDDWTETVKKLEKLEEQATKGLLKKAEKADWKGENAGVTLPFVKKTAKEFGDAAKEAQSIRNILRDAHTEFKAARAQLVKAVEDAPKKGIRVDSSGVVSYQIHPDRRAKDYDGPEPKEADFDQVRAEIKQALKRANEADEVASRALRTLVGKDTHNFSGTEYDSLKQAGRAQDAQDARAAAKIVAKGDDASPEEIARLNKYFENNRGDRYFAERFALEVGVKGNLEYWVDMGDPSDGSRLGVDHPKEIKELQKNWSLTLAAATHSDSAEMTRWKADMIKAGDDIIQSRGTSTHGFQVMSNLMREGVYDKKFLHDFGDAVVVTERRMTGDGRISPSNAWGSGLAMTPKLNWDGKDLGSDPMAGYMEALGHNPEASLDFFDRSTNVDGEKLSNCDYFVGDGKQARDWPVGVDGKPMGFENLGHALESATLGYAYDDKDPSIPPVQTEEQIEAREERTALASKIVENYSSADTIDKHPGIRGSLANIAAGHIDSLNYSIANWGGSGDLADRDGLFNHEGKHLRDMGEGSTANFMRALAADEESYNTVSLAQQAYGSSLIAAQGSHHDNSLDAGLYSISMHGLLDEARAESIGEEFADDAKERNMQLEKQGEWRNFAAGATVGLVVGVATELIIPTRAAAAIAVPLAFETAGGAAETYMATQTIDWLDENEYKNDQQAVEGIQKARQDGERNAMTPLLNYAAEHEMSPTEVRELVRRARGSYHDGSKYTDTDDARGW
ncbi:hypothetical protein LRR80_05973 [Streptomyces sp. RO-S4]|uniref:hypothetical protein n=1 Tax=Streptomyces sp. RO-S4 TaxID=2902486 RepID=UPI00208EC759|nr:hypothetical protein [Streptomyces sp. RO-S4]MCO4699872.1 hypothetical protein [Streptomyces sp. RO-S4]